MTLTFPNSRKTTQLPYLPTAQIALDDVFHLVDVSAGRSKQTSVADLIAAVSAGVGTGTVTSVSVVTHDGVSGTVATATTTPAITLTLGDIVPTSVNSVVISGASTPTLLVTGTSSVSGPNTGDQTISIVGDVSAPGSTGVLTATLATITSAGTSGGSTAIPVVTIDAKGRVTGITTSAVIAPAGTLTGTTIANNVLFSSLTSVGALVAGTWNATTIAVTKGGTGLTTYTPYAILTGGTTSTGNLQQVASLGSLGQVLTSNGAGALPTWATPTTGTVTSVSVVTANGVSGTVATATTTPAITLSLGAITPTSTNGLTIVTTVGGILSVSDGVTLTVPGSATVTNTNTGDQSFTASGDATAPGSTSTLVLTIGNDVVTYAKMQNVSATSRILARRSSGAGDVEECTLTQILDFVGSAVQGDVLFRNASTWTRLPAGTSGQFLKTLGTGADPIWDGVSGAAGGTVTSVGITGNDGILVSGTNPVTSSGTIVLDLGNITPTTVNGLTIDTTTGTFDLLSGKTFAVNNTLTFNGTDSSTVQFSQGGTVAYVADKLSVFAQTSSAELAATISDETGTNKLVFSDNALLSTPTITAPNITGGYHVAMTNLGIRSTGTGAFDLTVKNTENLTAGRDLIVVMGDANRTLTFAGNATISNTNSGDQLYTASGDATAPSSASNLALTLATVNSSVGTFGSSTSIPSFTVNAKGLITAASGNAVVAPAGTLTGSTLAANVLASSLTSVGVLGAGTWQATTVTPTYGGTGSNLSATGGASQVLRQSSTGANVTVSQLAASDLSNGTTGSNQVVLATNPSITGPTILQSVTVGGTTTPVFGFDHGGGTTTALIRSPSTSGDSLSIQGFSTGTSAFSSLFTVTSGATATGDLATGVTIGGAYVYRAGGTDVPVADGGTGASSFTAYAVVCGGTTTTNPLQSVASVGTVGQVLTSNGAGALPTFQSPGAATITLTGDVTGSGTSSITTTLATVNSNVGSFGSSTAIPTLTVNAKGLITAVGTSAVVAPAGTLTGATLASNVLASSLTSVGALTGGATGAGFTVALSTSTITGTLPAANMPALTGDVTTSEGAVATTLATVNSNVGSFGSSTSIPTFTVNAKGLITAASGNAVVAPAGTLTGGTLASGVTLSSLTQVGTLTSGTWNAAGVTVPYGGTGAVSFTAYAVICGGTTSTGALQSVSSLGTSGQVLTSNGAGALPTWQTVSGGGSGTVTSVTVAGSDGINVTNPTVTTLGTITLDLTDITPDSVVSAGTIRSGTSSNGVLAVRDNTNNRNITLTGGDTVLILGGTGNPALSLPSNLRMPSGGEINWNGGDVKLVHSSNLLTLTGGDLALGTNSVVSGNWLGNTIAAAVGGSGRTTSVAYAPICGGTGTSGASVTTAHQSVASAGNSGEVFVSQGGTTLPTWSTLSALINTWKATVTGYNGSVRQFLTHDSSGAFEWKNTSAVC